MEKVLRSALVMMITACLTIAAAHAKSYDALVVGIADGDTIKVLHNGQTETLRLAEIDCPEKTQAYGTAAKQFTAQLVFRKTVLVDTVGQDRYRRSIAQVKLPNGDSLNRELVKQGFAWQYSKYSKDADLQMLEEEARSNRRGLWQAPDTVPPWTFRKTAGRSN
jgi:endonuclease YncB( thermonuclease family)